MTEGEKSMREAPAAKEGEGRGVAREKERASETGLLYELFASALQREALSFPVEWGPEKRREQLVERLALKATDAFPEYAGDIEELLARVENNVELKNQDDVIRVLAGALSTLMASRVSSPEELAERFSHRVENTARVNRLLAYAVDGNTLYLSVTPVFGQNPLRLRNLWFEGLRELAKRIVHGDEFNNVDVIRGESWIVFEHPELVEKLGFTVTSMDNEKRIGIVEMSTQKFLERYLINDPRENKDKTVR